ncbi:PDZ domain-containing protein GIPC2 isoform X1 [Rattus norvegicus]|uniref:PDZ domain-containing protein GIPC2 isoform X1 n=1 Tax=Rattus norvegicus TaxID=10116 RepID=UPI0019175EF3|nr:PDZ domain-containing protein GIPC2 isoform X1 [Rattus norvegicus]
MLLSRYSDSPCCCLGSLLLLPGFWYLPFLLWSGHSLETFLLPYSLVTVSHCFTLTLNSQRIKDGSTIDSVKTICVGDHIECINGENIVGWRHFEVAKKLKELKKEELFTLQLIEPKKAFEIGPRSKAGKTSTEKIGTSRGTLRLRSKGPATVEDLPSEAKAKAIEKVDDLLELYMGIRDIDLATTMFEAGKDKSNPDEFAVALDETLGDFAFPDEFMFDVWGAISDVKQGR